MWRFQIQVLMGDKMVYLSKKIKSKWITLASWTSGGVLLANKLGGMEVLSVLNFQELSASLICLININSLDIKHPLCGHACHLWTCVHWKISVYALMLGWKGLLKKDVLDMFILKCFLANRMLKEILGSTWVICYEILQCKSLAF